MADNSVTILNVVFIQGQVLVAFNDAEFVTKPVQCCCDENISCRN